MMISYPRLIVGFCMTFSLLCHSGASDVSAPLSNRQAEPSPLPLKTIRLVREGQQSSIIVLPHNASESLIQLSKNFCRIVNCATGAEIQIVDEQNIPKLEDNTVKIFIGRTKAAELEPHLTGPLEEESYRIYASRNNVFIIGHEGDSPSQPIKWALNRLLEDGLGVCFLWPGETGTYIPKSRSFALPEMDEMYQPKLLIRNLRVLRSSKGNKSKQAVLLEKDADEWLQNHQIGRRGNLTAGHAFTKWWDKYGAEHPNYFATPPENMTQPVSEPNHPARAVKLRLSNPAVLEQIAIEYQAAGAPKYYSVCPNDGVGFDLTPATLTWDSPPNQDLMSIWKGKDTSNLTARYITFWNLLSERLRKINPDVALVSYAYMSYRHAPDADHPLTGRMVIGIVDGWDAYDAWTGWRRSGADLLLRPNWGYASAGAPLLPLDEIYNFLSFAQQNGMIGFDLDQVMGYWASEGINYYLIARKLSRPDLSKEAILSEYTGAFGTAAGKIREYLDYWQTISTQYGYPLPAGGTTGTRVGEYKRLQEEGTISDNFYHGPYEALPYLYDEKTLAPAYALLDQAEDLVLKTDRTAWERVRFLRSGLDHLRLIRDQVSLGKKVKGEQATTDEINEFARKSLELDRLRSSLGTSNALWSEAVTQLENRFKAPTRPKNIGK